MTDLQHVVLEPHLFHAGLRNTAPSHYFDLVSAPFSIVQNHTNNTFLYCFGSGFNKENDAAPCGSSYGPQHISCTVPKAFSTHETFPKLLGKISKTTWKYWGGQNF
jgi:hypothetical protein